MSDQTITSLIEKLEGAEVGGRELDLDVAQAFSLKLWGRRHPSTGSHQWMTEIGGRSVPVPRFTTSLDAALALAERLVGGKEALLLLSDMLTREADASDFDSITVSDLPRLLCATILRAQSEARV